MPTYILLLRGINVSGHNLLKMKDLQKSLAELKLEDIRTYLQSGNAVFQTDKGSEATLSKKIHDKIYLRHGLDLFVLVKEATKLAKIAKSNPFLKEKELDLTKLH